ncbi:MAG: hypothetical protein ACP5JH_00635 [Bacteroidota bacterium]
MRFSSVSEAILLSLSLMAFPLHAQTEKERGQHVGQLAVAAGMGVTEIIAYDVVDYLNQFIIQRENRIDQFGTASEFFAAPEFRFGDSFSTKLEYAYLLKSYQIIQAEGTHDVAYAVHMPTFVLHRIIDGDGYALKFGGGVGYYFGSFDEKLSAYGMDRTLRASGVGIKLDVEGNTTLGDNLFVYLGIDARWSFIPTLRDGSGNNIIIRVPNEAAREVSMRFFSAGIKLGILFVLR